MANCQQCLDCVGSRVKKFALENIEKSAIKKLVVLDTIYLPEERLIDKIEQISIAELIAEAITRIHEKRPLSPLFEMGTAK